MKYSNKFKPIPILENKNEEIKEVSNINQTIPTDMEKKYVYDVYDKIAPHFSSTRYKPWPMIVKFL